jgi:hypothetical protein
MSGEERAFERLTQIKILPHGWQGGPTDKNLISAIVLHPKFYPWYCLAIRGVIPFFRSIYCCNPLNS